ncbi:DNA cytosine methyltransferase [Streptomyces amritsarensis]|uniref:DNA (cytosine-5-)-methyltransferase n=1 Tax=Streptomyces amritsarensis TaxID=681158 RepID=A0ABX3G9J7_9ACTN|nr:DNA cytosine methyltransferase [Streptomyces amritsarensis]OLZ72533.1 DNA cytosine methyltransferase [Streptomyces amritsarensis]
MIVDLFAGPGGWSEGLRLLQLSDVGLEWCGAACNTRAAAQHLTVQCDVAQYPTRPFDGRISGLIASPPCQAWSRAGKGLGLLDQPLVRQAVHELARGRDSRAELRSQCRDERSILAAEPMRWMYDLRPEWVCMEEVPDVLPLWKEYAGYLTAWGYSVWTGILNAADYGVPQTRKRAILIASRVRTVTAPVPSHAEDPEYDLFGECLAPWVSMADALGWGATDRPVPTVTAGGGKTGGAEPFPSQARAALEASRDRGDWALRNGTQKNAAVRSADEPAGTLFFGARCNDVSWVLRNGNQPNAAVRNGDEPAPTMAFGNNAARVEWVLHTNRNQQADGTRQTAGPHDAPAPTFTAKSGGQWVLKRPATTVCATDRIAPPGHRDRSPKGESQFANPDTVRITQAEAAVLQSFRADYPWQGTKTKQFEQIGNAIPPRLALHIVSAATGIPVPAGFSPRA